MEDSELVASVLGEKAFDAFLRSKQDEWDDYRHDVSPYELNRYLGVL
jgi:glutamine synthetase